MNYITCIPVIGPIIYAAKELHGWYDTRADEDRTIEVIAERIHPLDDFRDNQVVALVAHVAYLILGFAFARALQWSPLGLALLAVSVGAFLGTGLLFWSSGRRLEHTRMKVMQEFQDFVVRRYEVLKAAYPAVFAATIVPATWKDTAFRKTLADLFPKSLCEIGSNRESQGAVEKVWSTRDELSKVKIKPGVSTERTPGATAYYDLTSAHSDLRFYSNRDDVSKFQEAVRKFEEKFELFKAEKYGRSTGGQLPRTLTLPDS